MKLEKMKRCQKAVHGFKGTFNESTFFNEVLKLKDILGDENMVETSKWGTIKQPNWFIGFPPASASRWNKSTGVGFTIYVNDESIVNNLLLISQESE